MAVFNLTRKADYGLSMLANMAQKGQGGLVSIKSMSDELGLPRAFLAQIGQDLVKAGIVGSKEGRNGGYFLIKEPNEVNIQTALEAIEGKIALVSCDGGKKECPLGGGCEKKTFMCDLSADVKSLLSGYSLTDLVRH